MPAALTLSPTFLPLAPTPPDPDSRACGVGNYCGVSTAASAPSGAEVWVVEDVGCTVGSGFVGEAALFGVALLDCVDLGVNVIE